MADELLEILKSAKERADLLDTIGAKSSGGEKERWFDLADEHAALARELEKALAIRAKEIEGLS
jgi:hypothetical protein